MAPPHPAPPSETPIFRTPDEILQDIFLRLPTAADLARASAVCPSFRRLIIDHAFLSRYRALHPPPLIGVVDEDAFFPAQPPHPSAVAARAFAGFDFSCSSFLPSTAGRAWWPLDFLDGRALLASMFESHPQVSDTDLLQLFFSDLVVCDPVHRRYILLPAVPGHLTALVPKPDILNLEAFLAPGDDEADPLSFRVMCLVRSSRNMLLLVFSSLDGQWRTLTFHQRSVPGTFDPYRDCLSDRQVIGRCFCWHSPFINQLLLLDTHSMEFSAVSLPPEQLYCHNFFIVEAAEGMLGMLSGINDGHNDDGPYRLVYSILRNDQWHSEKVIPLPEMYDVILFGVAGGYVLMHAYTTSSQEKLWFFSVDVMTLQVELFGEGSYNGDLYAGLPPSLCAPTIRSGLYSLWCPVHMETSCCFIFQRMLTPCGPGRRVGSSERVVV